MTEPAGPITFTYDRARRRRTATFIGRVEDGDLLEAYAGLIASPDYDFAADDLADLREVTHFGVTPEGLQDLMEAFAAIDRLGVRTRLAIVAPSDHVFGISRMYQTLRSKDSPEEIAVFRELSAAEQWLSRGPVI